MSRVSTQTTFCNFRPFRILLQSVHSIFLYPTPQHHAASGCGNVTDIDLNINANPMIPVVEGIVEDITFSPRQSHDFEHRSAVANGGEMMMSEVCLTYTVKAYDDCAKLDSLFLPLCQNNDTDFNASALTADDLTGIITETSDGISAAGSEIYDALGVMVDLEDFEMFESESRAFTLCMANVSVDVDYRWGDADRVDVANWVVFAMEEHQEGCTNNDGLPCLNYIFNPQSEDTMNCDCNGGMRSVTARYTGSEPAVTIQFYRGTDVLCTFSNVLSDEQIACSLVHSDETHIGFNVQYGIVYLDDDIECNGPLKSSCSGEDDDGCGGLEVVEWEDMDSNVCDETQSSIVSVKSKMNNAEREERRVDEEEPSTLSESEETARPHVGTGAFVVIGGMVVSIMVLLHLIIKKSRKSITIDCEDSD